MKRTPLETSMNTYRQ